MSKIRYEIDLTRAPGGIPHQEDRVRPVSADDAADLADLMLDAYRGTIDYDDEDLDDAVAEVDSYLNDRHPLLDFSRVVDADGVIMAGILLSDTESGPFIDYVMTRARYKGQGLAGLVTRHALAALSNAGHEKVVFYITAGNEPSERLFRSFGAEATN